MSQKTVLRILISVMVLNSCTKDYETPEGSIQCATSYAGHPKNAEYQAIADQYAVDGFVGMTLLIDAPEDDLWIGSSGYADIEDNVKMTPCHIQYTASLYKTFIATVIMQLVEEDALNLNDRLADHLASDITEQLPNGGLITLKQLLQHRTGIPDIFEVEFVLDFFNDPYEQYTVEELLEYVYDKSPLSDPGTEFHYSDANFSLLSLVIDQVEGSSVDAIRNRIFSPLDLSNTYFLESSAQAPDGLVDSYWDRYGDGMIENNSDIQLSLAIGLNGSDGIVTSAKDLNTYLRALSSGQLGADIGEMTEFLAVTGDALDNVTYSAYGLGLMKVNLSGSEWYGHFGNQVGSGAFMLYNAESDVSMIALQNTGTFFSDEIKSKFFYDLIVDLEAVAL